MGLREEIAEAGFGRVMAFLFRGGAGFVPDRMLGEYWGTEFAAFRGIAPDGHTLRLVAGRDPDKVPTTLLIFDEGGEPNVRGGRTRLVAELTLDRGTLRGALGGDMQAVIPAESPNAALAGIVETMRMQALGAGREGFMSVGGAPRDMVPGD